MGVQRGHLEIPVGACGSTSTNNSTTVVLRRERGGQNMYYTYPVDACAVPVWGLIFLESGYALGFFSGPFG